MMILVGWVKAGMYECDNWNNDIHKDDGANGIEDIDKIENCFISTLTIFGIVWLMIMNMWMPFTMFSIIMSLQIIIPCKI